MAGTMPHSVDFADIELPPISNRGQVFDMEISGPSSQ
jgi:hypothetical protein